MYSPHATQAPPMNTYNEMDPMTILETLVSSDDIFIKKCKCINQMLQMQLSILSIQPKLPLESTVFTQSTNIAPEVAPTYAVTATNIEYSEASAHTRTQYEDMREDTQAQKT
jgi:hypothetical protein